jgi:ATP-dependent DNA helicase UvrD/PcrA
MRKYILHEDHKTVETHIDFKGNLNHEQYEVVTKADGPCLVLAGAGSGKTRTLIYRLAYLLERGVDPSNILLMTFTNKAAREMKDRAEMILKYTPRGLWNGTFHHVGNRILRKFAPEIGFGRDFGILDQHDSRDLIRTCIKKHNGKVKKEKFPKPSVIQAMISFAANTDKTIDKVLSEKYPYFSQFSGEINAIDELYRKRKKESNNMDYDDLLVKLQWLLKNSESASKYYTEKFHYVMVDEYQDTNLIQADIVDMLGGKHNNILVVGDDAQSIYSFRGARVENILSFPRRFSGTQTFKLETNYRSAPEILNLANDSLLNNDNQFPKKLKAVNPSLAKPVLVEVNNLYSQASFVVQRAMEMRNEGTELRDMVVLFRAHYQSAELEMELVKRGIPYIVRGGIRFFEQAHIKDVLAYLRIIVNPLDEVSWMRALTLCPGIGPGYAMKIFERFKETGATVKNFLSMDISGWFSQKVYTGYKSFAKIMRVVTGLGTLDDPGMMINSILEAGYEMHVLANFENAKDRVDDIHELANFSHDYNDLHSFLNDITLRENFRGETILSTGCDDEQLVLSTIHQAKGLEWDAVMVIGLCEGQFPHPKAMSEKAEMEEERRLFYVAVTRARKYLYLIHPATRYDYQKGTVIARESRFLEELDSEDYEVWEVGRDGQRDFDEEERTIKV